MLARTNRFHGQASLRRLQRNCQVVRGPQVTLKYAPNLRRNHYRLAVVVSRKVSKSAVTRNRIRRRIYENVRILSSNFTVPYDLLLVAYDEKLATLPAAVLSHEITKLLTKAQLFGPPAANHAIVKPKEAI